MSVMVEFASEVQREGRVMKKCVPSNTVPRSSGVARPGPSRARPDLTIDYHMDTQHMPSNLHAKRQSLDRDLCS